MVAISVLNGVIANQLLRMFREAEQDNHTSITRENPTMLKFAVESNRAQSLRHGVLVLRKYQQQKVQTPKENQTNLGHQKYICKQVTVSLLYLHF